MANTVIDFSSFIETVIPQIYFEQIRIKKASSRESGITNGKNLNLIDKQANVFGKTRLVESSDVFQETKTENLKGAVAKAIKINSFLLLDREQIEQIKDYKIFNLVYLMIKDNLELESRLANGEIALRDLNQFIDNGIIDVKTIDLSEILKEKENLSGLYNSVQTTDGLKDFYKYENNFTHSVHYSIKELSCFAMIVMGKIDNKFDERTQKFGPINAEKIITNSEANTESTTYYTQTGRIWTGPVHEMLKPDGTVGYMTGFYHGASNLEEELIAFKNVENSKTIDDSIIQEIFEGHLEDMRTALSTRESKVVLISDEQSSDKFKIEKKFSISSEIYSSINEDNTTSNLFFVNKKNLLLANSRFANTIERIPDLILESVISKVQPKKAIINRFGEKEISSEDTVIMDLDMSSKDAQNARSLNYTTKFYSILEPDTVFSTFTKETNIKINDTKNIEAYSFIDYLPFGVPKSNFYYDVKILFEDGLRDFMTEQFRMFKKSLESYKNKLEIMEKLKIFNKNGKINKIIANKFRSLIVDRIASELPVEDYMDKKFAILLATYANLVNLLVLPKNKKLKKMIKHVNSSLNLNFTSYQEIKLVIKHFDLVLNLMLNDLSVNNEDQDQSDYGSSVLVKATASKDKQTIELNLKSKKISISSGNEDQNGIVYVADPALEGESVTVNLDNNLPSKIVKTGLMKIEIQNIMPKSIPSQTSNVAKAGIVSPIRIIAK